MLVPPKKNQYALRAIFELAKHMDQGPVKISDIATAQSIPLRFLEVILNQLKASGIVDSKRGFYGGYFLVKPPDQVSVGDVLRFLSRELSPSDCIACVSKTSCPFDGRCAFSSMWIRVKQAAFDIYDETSFQDLIDRERDTGWPGEQ
ncbi:Rrf2 family transcriptional regulator [Desulfosarcina sp.]|jgi:Rrf2 family protein|uniref:RrF2 family transcriptional regulator n=1 Tax=Desulfosarcina sp. TaxID=2027861 RepID=UPI00356749C0